MDDSEDNSSSIVTAPSSGSGEEAPSGLAAAESLAGSAKGEQLEPVLAGLAATGLKEATLVGAAAYAVALVGYLSYYSHLEVSPDAVGIDYVTVIIHGFVGLVFFFAVFAVFLVVVAAPTEAVLARLRSRRRATYLGVVNSGKGDMSFPAPTAADREWFFVSLAPPLWVSYIFFQFTMVDQYTGTSYTNFASWEPYATLAVVWLVWLFTWRSFAQACKRRPARYRRSLASAILIGLIGMLLMTDMLGDTMGSFLFSNQYLPGYFTSAFATISVRSELCRSVADQSAVLPEVATAAALCRVRGSGQRRPSAP